VIVVDDDSRDNTAEVARRFGVSYLHVEHHNISLTRNAGLARVETPYVTFLDDDDAWLPGNLEHQLDALEARPEAAFAFGIARCATENLEPLPWTFPAKPLASGHVPGRLHLGYPQLGVVLFRRDVIIGLGGFDPSIPYHQDAELMLRIAAQHEIIGTEDVGMLYRLRPPSRTRADYLWRFRGTMAWRPQGLGLCWRTHLKFMASKRTLYFHSFLEDASACSVGGLHRDALICVSRALRTSPPHAVRHARSVAAVVKDTLARRYTRITEAEVANLRATP
jgi:glycosyltransferase involved in cell wall biosynthesis